MKSKALGTAIVNATSAVISCLSTSWTGANRALWFLCVPEHMPSFSNRAAANQQLFYASKPKASRDLSELVTEGLIARAGKQEKARFIDW